MAFKMKGPSLLKMVAELKKSIPPPGTIPPTVGKEIKADIGKLRKLKVKPLPVSTDVKLKTPPTKKSFKPETMKKTSGGKSGSLNDVVTNIKGKAIKALDKIEKKAFEGMEKPLEQASQRTDKLSTLIPGFAQATGILAGPVTVGGAANIGKKLLQSTKSTKTKAFGKKASPTKKDKAARKRKAVEAIRKAASKAFEENRKFAKEQFKK